jgi:hypothetical protein
MKKKCVCCCIYTLYELFSLSLYDIPLYPNLPLSFYIHAIFLYIKKKFKSTFSLCQPHTHIFSRLYIITLQLELPVLYIKLDLKIDFPKKRI